MTVARPALLDPASMPAAGRLRVPEDLYTVALKPAPLSGMVFPRPDCPWDHLHLVGLRQVVCLAGETPPYEPAPLECLAATFLEDLVGDRLPRDAAAEEQKIRTLASMIVKRLTSGEGVVVHCVGGRGRTGTVLGVVLRLLGYASDEVIRSLWRIHVARGHLGWPESLWQEEVVRRSAEGKP